MDTTFTMTEQQQQQQQQQQRTKCHTLHRFVLPDQQVSLSDDAPGWGAGGRHDNHPSSTSTRTGSTQDDDADNETNGPICWKCRGTRLAASQQEGHFCCKVCHGKGRLPLSKKRRMRHVIPGRITGRARRKQHQQRQQQQQAALLNNKDNDHDCNDAKKDAIHSGAFLDNNGPLPAALQEESNCSKWTELVKQADQGVNNAIEIGLSSTATATTPTTYSADDNIPDWIPRAGEELCCLTGKWRVLQKVACHRWTTDDLVTAWMARQQLIKLVSILLHQKDSRNNNKKKKIHYLDLGTGNASVLQMVLWAAYQMELQDRIQALGIEARFEAVTLARRSLLFNIGKQQHDKNQVRIQHADFRSFDWSKEPQACTCTFFDLITGTPPYFRVEFVIVEHDHQEDDDRNNNNNSSSSNSASKLVVVQEARIQQGGMPTAKQSAPARCEFRGGIEAYCQTAARILKKPTGIFVVCENWKNHARVLQAAADSHLRIVECLPVEGRPGKGNLFAVYVMKHVAENNDDNGAAGKSTMVNLRPTLTVRDMNGNWSKEYQDTVMSDMAIPRLGAM